MHRTLYTIGYEGTEIDQFVSALVDFEIQQILDIREVPISRKRGFSKNKLASALDDRNIIYRHMKALGDPKLGREAMRRGDYLAFVDIYSNHLACEVAQDALREAADCASVRTSALLCFERSPEKCHRRIVANAMEEMAGFAIYHIGMISAVTLPRSKQLVSFRL
jgi:uncharacterized protein (DUF488 family)